LFNLPIVVPVASPPIVPEERETCKGTATAGEMRGNINDILHFDLLA
jgi:hypothetical protein